MPSERIDTSKMGLASDPLAQIKNWELMANDIEKYQKMKELIIESFKSILDLMPPQVKITVQDKINNLNNTDAIYEYEELIGFIKLAKIHSESLLSSLDDKDIPDYAAPYKAVSYLNTVISLTIENDSENNLNQMGVAFVGRLHASRDQIEKIDWAEGWK